MGMESQAWRSAMADLERTATERGRRALGAFAIEGLRLHERALNAGAPLRRVVVAAGLAERLANQPGSWEAEPQDAGSETEQPGSREAETEQPGSREARLLQRLAERTELIQAPDAEVARWTSGRDVGALLGLAELPPAVDLDRLFARSASPPRSLLVGVEIEDPGNVGALVRTGLAGGAGAYVRVGSGDPFHPRAVQTSRGSLFKLPLARMDIGELLETLRRLGVRTVGTATRGGRPLDQVAFSSEPTAFFMGSEAFGLSPQLVRRLDDKVSIPMRADVDSYSVNAASAILLYARG